MATNDLLRTGIQIPASSEGLAKSIALFANYAAISADNAGNIVGSLLIEHLEDESVVKTAHDILNELYTIRLAGLLLLELSGKMMSVSEKPSLT